jgi:hypothetical protein
MSAQTEIRDRILGDLKDDKILQNVTLERLWYYFELIGDITGSGGANFSYGSGAPSGGVDGDYYIRTDATQIWYNNGGTWQVTLSLTPLQITGDEFAALVAAPAGIIDGQVYHVVPDGGDTFALPLSITDLYITGSPTAFMSGALAGIALTGRYEFVTYYTSDNTVFQNSVATLTVDLAQAYFTGNDIQNSSVIVNTDYVIISGGTALPTGISRIKGKAILDPSGNVVWDSSNCEAWVTAASAYIECSYDIVSNTVAAVIEQEFLIVDIDGNPTLTVLKNDTPSITFTVELISSNTPYRIISSVEIWNATKTKVKGFSFLNATAEPNISSGSFESTTKIQVNAFNPISLSNEPKAASSELTFKVITTL